MEKITQPIDFLFTDTEQVINFLQHFGVTEMINWTNLSRYISGKFDLRLILEKFPGRFDFRELSANEAIKWDSRMIADYYDRIDWKKLTGNKSVEFSDPDVFKKYEHKFEWDILSANPGFPHDIDTVQKYESRINWTKLGSQLKVFIIYIGIADYVSSEEEKQTETDFALLLHYRSRWNYKRGRDGYRDQSWEVNNSIFDNSKIEWHDEHIRKHFVKEIEKFNLDYKKCI